MLTKSEVVWLFLGAGLLVWMLRAPPKFSGWLHGIAASAPIAGAVLVSSMDWPRLV